MKYWNGEVSPYSSPMNSSGSAGAENSSAAATFTAAKGAMVESRSPTARLPTWSWFCRQIVKRSPPRSALGVPRGRAKYSDGSPWKAKPSAMARARPRPPAKST